MANDYERDAESKLGAATGTRLPSSYSSAAQPLLSQAVVTDAEGLVAGEVMIATADGEISSYRAMPSGMGPFALILVIQEIFGVHEHIRDVCRRLAKQGYMAVAPELYARQGDPSRLDDVKQILNDIVERVPTVQVMADLDAWVSWSVASGFGDRERLAITGFCWGGGIVWLYAAHNPQLKAGVAWYGRLEGSRTELQPQQAMDVAAHLKVPVLGLYGEKDVGIPLASVQRMQKALDEAATDARIIIYPDTPHGFFADYRASYRPGQAAEAWQEMLAWLRRFGVTAEGA